MHACMDRYRQVGDRQFRHIQTYIHTDTQKDRLNTARHNSIPISKVCIDADPQKHVEGRARGSGRER